MINMLTIMRKSLLVYGVTCGYGAKIVGVLYHERIKEVALLLSPRL